MTRRGTSAYDASFFDRRQEGALRSAREIVPVVVELVRPASVIDVGCARGEWLSVFREHGVEHVRGVDGDSVDPSRLLIPQDAFSVRDLSAGLDLEGAFDLAVSLEVAEHLPSDAADRFVASLARLAPVVLFSAAVPFQGGTGHQNEQWPSYWAGRFAKHEMVPLDAVRPRCWRNAAVLSWYRQNTLLYVREERLERDERLRGERLRTRPEQLDVVLPEFYEKRAHASTRRLWKQLRRRLIRV